MRTLALYIVIFGCITAALIFFSATGGPFFVEEQYNRNRPSKPQGPPISHSESHAWQTQREWIYKYPRDARNYGLDELQCQVAFPDLYKEVDRAAAWWKERGGVTEREIDVGWRGDGIVRAMIYDNQLYVIDAHGVFDHNHRPRALATLHSLHRAVTAHSGPLPNVEFTMTDHDAPLIDQEDLNHTTWGYARLAHQENLWLMPDFGYWGWPNVGLRSYSELQQNLAAEEEDFLDKIPQIVWRGAVEGLGSHDVRAGLLAASANQPWSDILPLDWSNATNIATRLLGMEDHCAYQFLAQTEGNTYSGRLKSLLNCHSVLLSHKLSWIEHFHHLLQPSGPDQNYVQTKRDFSDLPKKMRSLLNPSNILATQRIADNARAAFRERYLTPAAEACYWRALIRAWADVQTFEVQGWKEKLVEDPTTGRKKLKRSMRGAPFEAYAIMEEVEWELPAKARRVCIDE
ncbi:hypothetical protein WHR41_02673 [Cladosporium halotolerans]|uniref:Glycosyl transferase CAP10 domain-containing protein n=1 Tax=Cladosporium halotolerans TaxID=1052096 RepID=A0AB34KYV3_9PEZI